MTIGAGMSSPINILNPQIEYSPLLFARLKWLGSGNRWNRCATQKIANKFHGPHEQAVGRRVFDNGLVGKGFKADDSKQCRARFADQESLEKFFRAGALDMQNLFIGRRFLTEIVGGLHLTIGSGVSGGHGSLFFQDHIFIRVHSPNAPPLNGLGGINQPQCLFRFHK